MRHLSLSLGCLVLSSLALASTCPAQQGQHHLFTFRGDALGDSFGFAVCGVGDINRDGVSEVCVGAYAANGLTGYVRILGGRTGRVMATIHGGAQGDQFGYAISAAGDVNKDGWPDLVVGAPGSSTSAGYVQVISGLWILTNRSTKVLHAFPGKATGDQYGFSVSDAGDVDKDGYADVLVGGRRHANAGTGIAEVRSGRTGAALHSYLAGTGVANFGQSVCHAGDVNNDGYPDAVIGGQAIFRVMSGKDGKQLRETRNMGGKSVSGAGDVNNDKHDDVMVFDGMTPVPKTVRVFSGKDWSVLHNLSAGSASAHTTFHGKVGDVNGDGHADVIVQNGGSTQYPVSIYSGKDARRLLSLTGPATFGHSVRGVGDLDGDKVPDVMVGEPGSSTTFGSAHVYSSRKLALATDVHQVTAAQGGTQTFSLDAGTANGSRLYWIFGSVTGTSPGVTLASAAGSVNIPLNPDFWTDITIGLANSAILTNTRGRLGATGTGSASFNLPKITNQSAIGVTFQHAYLVYDAQSNFYMASNPVPLTLVK